MGRGGTYMKIVFFGTPEYVVPVLKALKKQQEILAVVTQPPKEVGRKKIRTFSPVDNYAHKKNIPVLYDIKDTPNAKMGVVVAYGKIIPQDIISKFPLGILNIHYSLLPKFRGSSPLQQNIIEDPENIGATIIKIVPEMDKGPILTSFEDELLPNDTTETLRERLTQRSIEVLLDLIPLYEKGKINLKPQDESKASYTKIIIKQDGYVSLTKDDPEIIYRKFRAYQPWPGIWTKVEIKGEEKRLKILKCHLKNNKLVLDEVQLEGKNTVNYEQFKEAYNINF